MKHFYPGMGATSSMYGALWREAFSGQFHDWPKWNRERTLKDFAKRVIEEHKILSGDTVIGTSLGGIIACEISNLIELERIVLIGSAQRKEEINKILDILHPLIDLAPIKFIQLSSGKLPIELLNMFSASDPDFIRNTSKMIFNWDGMKSDIPVTRIHGKKDLVIPLPNRVDCEIDGGHLIVMSNPMECIKHLKENKS